MALLLSLIIASFVGKIIWIVQNSIKPVTQKVFSQTWHYYTGFIPVFFLLGGSEIINRLIPFIRSVLPDTGTSPKSGTIAEQYVQVPTMEQTATSSASFMNQLFDYLLRIENIKEIVLSAIVIWAVGTTVFLAVNVRKYRAFKRSILQESRICDTVLCPVKVIVSANATTPMVMGLWKPMVVLPDTQFREKELTMILSHELIHLKRGDLFVKLLVLIANAIHWFNPAAYSLNKQINTLCELSCDEKVVQEMDMENRRFYGETLLSMLEYGVMQRNVACTSSLCNPKKYMKRRLLNLMNVKKTKKSIIMLSLVATIAMVGSGGLVTYAAGSVVPSKATPSKATPSKQMEGRNVYVQSPDGTVEHFDKDGNRMLAPHMKKNIHPPVDEKTQKKIDELNKKIDSYIQRGLPAPQKYLDAINELYGIKPFGDK
ncbi:M56 family metallopeptidase [Cohnella abietis]|nr:M56 family metallopeptidase [Cohnella abietis]